MAVATTTLIIASIVATAAATSYQTYAENEASNAAHDAAQAAAAAEKDALNAQAAQDVTQIKSNADRFKKTQMAAAAKAGLFVNEGTALGLRQETDTLAQKDINTVGQNLSSRLNIINTNAANSIITADNKATLATGNALFNFTNTALGQYSNYNAAQNQHSLQTMSAQPKTNTGYTLNF